MEEFLNNIEWIDKATSILVNAALIISYAFYCGMRFYKAYNKSIFESIKEGDITRVQKLINRKNFDPNLTDKDRNTPIHCAVSFGDLEIVKILISANCDVNLLDQNENSPLHISVRNGNISITELLIESGADVNKKDKNGHSPLHIIYFHFPSSKDIISNLLIDRGAIF